MPVDTITRTSFLVTYGTQSVIVTATSPQAAVEELCMRIRHATHLIVSPLDFKVRAATDHELDRLDPKDAKGRRTRHVSAP
jgi:hypothetical protein